MTFLHSEDSYSWKLRPISYSRCGFIHFMLTFTLTGEAASHCSCSLAATGDLDRLCKVPTATPASAAAQLQALYPPVQTDLDRRERESRANSLLRHIYPPAFVIRARKRPPLSPAAPTTHYKPTQWFPPWHRPSSEWDLDTAAEAVVVVARPQHRLQHRRPCSLRPRATASSFCSSVSWPYSY
jgi:hypothetical protein